MHDHWCRNGYIAGQEQGHAYPPQYSRKLNDYGRCWSSQSSTQVRRLLPNIWRCQDWRSTLLAGVMEVWRNAHAEARWPIELCILQRGVLLRLCWARCASATLRSRTSTRSSSWGSVTVLTPLTFVIAWPSHRLHSARSPAYGQTTGCLASWNRRSTSYRCVRHWHTYLKPGCSLSQWCAVWTGLTADSCT